MKGQILFRGALIFAVALAVSVGALSSRAVAHAQTAKPTVAVETVVYSEVRGEKLQLDVYQPPVRSLPRPAVLLFHPGSAITGTRDIMTDQAQGLADAGYVAFNADYRLLQPDNSNRWPAQLDDAQLLVRWVRTNADRYHVDPNRICALGYSFGGQLAELLGERDTPTDGSLTLGTYSSRVACVVAYREAGNARLFRTSHASCELTKSEMDAEIILDIASDLSFIS